MLFVIAGAACAAEKATTATAAHHSSSSTSITLEDFKLIADLSGDQAAFTLNATAIVDSSGGSLELVSGTVALTDLGPHPKWNIRAEPNRFVLDFDKSGKYPIQIKFNAAVRENDRWKTVEFHVAQSALQPIVLKGLPEDTKFDFSGASRPDRKGSDFTSFLPSDGSVKISWRQAKTETEGKLFYSSEMLSQIAVSPGLMRQSALLNFKVMQGELNRVVLLLHGAGEVTRVQGDQVLAWNVEPNDGNSKLQTPNSKLQSRSAVERPLNGSPSPGGEGRGEGELSFQLISANRGLPDRETGELSSGGDRRLVIQLNQPQKDQFALQVQMQTPLGAFPQSVDAMQLRPEGTTRFSGYFRIVNEGAVRLEVTQASGLSQVSPEQFPETDLTKSVLRLTGSQRFAYRFSSGDFALRIQADQVLPELNVSEILAYRLGENEQTIEADIELEIREAPLRELLLHIPKGYAIAKLNASGLSDYFQHDLEGGGQVEVRLVYGQPISGRQLVQLRLERNKALGENSWTLPRLDVPRAKSVRGHLAIAADAGFRLTAERTQGLTEIATAFFPAKVVGIQAAFRLSDSAWQALMRVERMPQTVQVDGFHLFSIGEGIAYGSSVMNYVISGAPVSAFQVELSDEYYNVEFTGKDIRDWKKTDRGYVVHLHTPVSGSYTLLVSYERPFKAQGDTLTFTGAKPLDAISDQGHTIIISAYQFQVKPAEVSSGLLQLETGEVPPEYRLFFDAPILRAYRYSSRPFNLKLALNPLTQGESLNQVVDRASITNYISKEGQILTDVRYFVKNRGNPHFRLSLPEGITLWSATVNGAAVVPVLDGKANLIPLPQRADPNAVLTVDLKLASRSKSASHVVVAAPIVSDAPVMLMEWNLQPDSNQRLVYQRGSLTPVGGVPDVSGFATLSRMFGSDDAARAGRMLLLALLFLAAALILWRWASRQGVYKFSGRYLAGGILGVVAAIMALSALVSLLNLADEHSSSLPRELSFVAPVQQAGTPLALNVSNLPEKLSVFGLLGYVWPAVLAVLIWLYGRATDRPWFRSIGWLLGWMVLAWGALRAPAGAPFFIGIFMAFLLIHVVVPVLVRLWRMPRQPAVGPSGEAGAAPAVTATLIVALAWICFGCADLSNNASSRPSVHGTNNTALAESVSQEIRVEEKFALATAKIRWRAEKGQTLPLLSEPAVLTRVSYPSNSLKLVQGKVDGKRAQQLIAEKDGLFDVEARYELRITKSEHESGFTLPVQFGLVNRLKLSVLNSDVDVSSPNAVSVQRETSGSNTVANLVLSPAPNTWIAWKPRSRDVKHEKPVFYVELSQLYAPAAGVIEGAHYVYVRPAQGQISELLLNIPTNATITDVLDGAGNALRAEKSEMRSLVSLWRFDPDTHKLRVTLNPEQSRPFSLLMRSQIPSAPLPFEQSVGLISVDGAAGQVGMLGFATGTDVQLDNVNATVLSAINLEDFSNETIAALQAQIPGLTLRRAFRYADAAAGAIVKASAVEPDVRVETQDTLSLGEDRTILAANAGVTISRAGIFRLSFVLPSGFEVEGISGPALSHWTELKGDSGRVITLHLTGKTEGQQQFSISLAGPGIRPGKDWKVPQVIIREAAKQRGTLLVVPEQGTRLQIASRDGVTQLDPQKAGIRQKGVLSFRILQTPWNLSLDVEQVDPWIQVTSLQHAKVTEAQMNVTANLQYQIENTGLKAFRVWVPTNAEGVRFQGEQVADFLQVPGALTNALQEWEVKLHRRVMGSYLLRVNYQQTLPENANEAVLRGVRAADVNLQRGFVTIQAGGRLQVNADAAPEALQAIEWQSIPRALQQDLQGAPANFAFRLVDPGFQLPVKIERHEAARLLPARVNNVTFNSVISDDGVMLTQARLEMLPGDKRLLHLRLPKDGHFWFAFVNQAGVWPWREQDEILIPLEQQCRTGQAIPVEVFYSCGVGSANPRALDLELVAPKFDLPLENITWRVCLSDKWKVKHWTGSLELDHEELVGNVSGVDLQNYLQKQVASQNERTKEAEEFLALGNTALQQGEPQEARRSFQAAFGLSGHDAAFNEDARVQLHNIKLQQALVGLNVRQAAAAGDTAVLGSKFRDLRSRKEISYTQQDAKDIIDRNTADDNSAFMRVAERIVQQQDAAISSPGALRATIPEQGRILTFKRSVVVDKLIDTKEDLKIGLRAKAVQPASWTMRSLILLGTLAVFGAVGIAGLRLRRE